MGSPQKPFYIVVSGSFERRRLPIQLLKHLAREHCLVPVRIGRGDVLERSPRGLDLFEVPEGKTFLVVRLGNRISLRVVANGKVVRLDRLVVPARQKVRVADADLAIGGLLGLGEILDERSET